MQLKFQVKNIFIAVVIVLSACTSVFFAACNRDKCKTVVCLNRGICNDGSCTCPSGHEGTNCETEIRKKFTGNWSVFEKGSNSLARQYGVSVKIGENVTDLLIVNFYNYFKDPVRAYVKGTHLTIPVQRMQGKIVYGEGDIYSNLTYGQFGGLTLRYIVQDSITLVKDDYGYEPEIDFSDPSNWNK